MKFDPIAVTKLVASGIVGIGTGKIIGKIIKNAVTPENLFEKVAVTAATFVIGAIATERTKSYTDNMIDDVLKSVSETITKIKLEQKLARITTGQSTFEKEGLDPSRFEKNEKDIWVFSEPSESPKLLDASTILEIIKTGGWDYNMADNSWVKMDENGKRWKIVQDKSTKDGVNWKIVNSNEV